MMKCGIDIVPKEQEAANLPPPTNSQKFLTTAAAKNITRNKPFNGILDIDSMDFGTLPTLPGQRKPFFTPLYRI
jgi:hypothetical protein